MIQRRSMAACLVFSGLTALVYQVIWTRLLGFTFGTTTEAVGTVLAVFFGGLALGNALAARWLPHVRRPLRLYALLELGIGVFALASLPLLRHLDLLYRFVDADASRSLWVALRFAAAAAVLLPPTLAMGATLPVVARGLLSDDASRGRWSAVLYAANTLGAVLGAYLCGFWLIPELGLSRAIAAAGCTNLAVAAAVLRAARGEPEPAPIPPAPLPGEGPIASPRLFLTFFALSGFVAIGYEVVWSKVFGIVMEGTLYGFATVLTAYLLGIALGSAAAAPFVDRIRDLPRAFALLHVAIAVTVAAGMTAVPYLPWAHQQLVRSGAGGDAVHLLFALVLPILLVPTALFGAAFPVLIRIYTHSAGAVGRGIGVATAVNTAGSIAASVIVGFWWIPELGMDASLYALVMLDLGVALLVLAGFGSPGAAQRRRALAGACTLALWVALGFNGVQVDRAIAGNQFRARDLADYVQRLEQVEGTEVLTVEGRSSIVTVYDQTSWRLLRTNGLPEAGYRYGTPHYPLPPVLLGALPHLTAERSERALVIGLGGGNTVVSLRRCGVPEIEVVELERGVVEAMDVLYAGRDNPLDDPHVELVVNDGRNELLLGARSGRPGYDVIASQPSHPWRVGAANLFTEEFFRLARANLNEGGRFALWVNGFRTDADSLLAVLASFERVFPGSIVVALGDDDPRDSFMLLGGREPVRLDAARMRERLAAPGLHELLAGYGIDSLEALLARIEGPTSVFSALDPDASNTDDNAFVETRVPRQLVWPELDFASVEGGLAPDAPVLPPVRGAIDVAAVAREILALTPTKTPWPHEARLDRLLTRHAAELDPELRTVLRATAALRDPTRETQALATLETVSASASPTAAVEALRVLGRHLALRRGRFREAAQAFARAHALSGEAADAYDTGRALHHVDAAEAWRWFERIPESERDRFPRLAFYAAVRALERDERGEALRDRFEDLVRYRDTEEGRTLPGVNELLGRLAWALGDPVSARAYLDASRLERSFRAEPAIARAEKELAAGHLDAAAAAVRAAAALLPGDERVTRLRARLAVADGDSASLEQALRDLRHWAPSLPTGIAAENRFRSRHELPQASSQPDAPAS